MDSASASSDYFMMFFYSQDKILSLGCSEVDSPDKILSLGRSKVDSPDNILSLGRFDIVCPDK